MESLKFCKDCKFFIQNGAKCNAFENSPPAIKVRPDPKKCGEDAKFFTAPEYSIQSVSVKSSGSTQSLKLS